MQAFIPMEELIEDAIPAGVLKLVPYQIGMMCQGWQEVVLETESGTVKIQPDWAQTEPDKHE